MGFDGGQNSLRTGPWIKFVLCQGRKDGTASINNPKRLQNGNASDHRVRISRFSTFRLPATEL
jgi:hypothetical protein